MHLSFKYCLFVIKVRYTKDLVVRLLVYITRAGHKVLKSVPTSQQDICVCFLHKIDKMKHKTTSLLAFGSWICQVNKFFIAVVVFLHSHFQSVASRPQFY